MEIAQVLYDVQFVAYLRKTFLDENNPGQLAKGSGAGLMPGAMPSPQQMMPPVGFGIGVPPSPMDPQNMMGLPTQGMMPQPNILGGM